MFYLWYALFYSFVGFLLEVVFARVTGHPKRDRKCFFLLPLCPVYGLGALLIRWLSGFALRPLGIMAAGFLGATAAELLVGLFYRYGLGVEFWSYRDQPLNLWGVVCLRFSGYWSLLALGMICLLDPWLVPRLAGVPDALAPPAVALLCADGLTTAAALRITGTTEVLRWYRK